MPFYVNSGSGIDPRLAAAANAGVARQYHDAYGLQRGQLDLGYLQANNAAANARDTLGYNYWQGATDEAYRRAALAEQTRQYGGNLDLNYAQLDQQGRIAGNSLDFNYAQLGQQDVQSQRQALLERAQQILDAQKAQAQFDLGTNQLNAQTWYQGQQLGQNRYGVDMEEAYRRAALAQQGDLGYAGINASANNAAMQSALGYAQLQSADARAADANAFQYAQLGQQSDQFSQNYGLQQQSQDWQRQYQTGQLGVQQQGLGLQQQGQDWQQYYQGGMMGIGQQQADTQQRSQAWQEQYQGERNAIDWAQLADPTKNLNMQQDNQRATLGLIIGSIARNPITGEMQPTPQQAAALQQLYQMGGVAGNPFQQPQAPLTINGAQPGNPWASQYNNIINQGAGGPLPGGAGMGFPLTPYQLGGTNGLPHYSLMPR